VNLLKRFEISTILILYYFLKIKSQIKPLFFKLIFSQIKSSENDLKSGSVKLQIKSLNTLSTTAYKLTLPPPPPGAQLFLDPFCGFLQLFLVAAVSELLSCEIRSPCSPPDDAKFLTNGAAGTIS
jgi:hypothetical protein